MISGCCKYCGQFHAIGEDEIAEILGVDIIQEATPEQVERVAGELAVEMCTCDGAIDQKEKEDSAERACASIDALVRGDYPKTADVLDMAVSEIAFDRLKSISVDTGAGIKFKMRRTRDGIAVERIETDKKVLES